MATLERASSGATRTPMNPPATLGAILAWQEEIRAGEEQARAAFRLADIPALERPWADGYAVKAPLQEVLQKSRLLALLQVGRIRHSAYEYQVEYMGRYGDVVVVMGRDRVADRPDGAVSRRCYTNVWRLENGRWRSMARHAHAVSREGA
jgi:hypothetical protein